jgi:putative 4-mercaptohistidine N1-methyltranferase
MSNPYETDRLLHEYLLFHYGEPERILPWAFGPREALEFPRRCVTESGLQAYLTPQSRALDVGCAVGAATFELARQVGEVVGIDFSRRFIEAADHLRREGTIPYRVMETGERFSEAIARRPDGIEASRVGFEVGDAQNLRADLRRFDIVIACNLLCRLPDPRKFLRRLPELVNPGGVVLITTPNTWLEEFTAKEYWLGATPETGEPLEALEAELAGAFERFERRDLPFLIREHRRKFQWSVAEATLWRRLA